MNSTAPSSSDIPLKKPNPFDLIGPGNMVFAVIAALVWLGSLAIASFLGTWEERLVSWAIITTANLMSIPVGLLVTPQYKEEKESFSAIGKALSAFVTGWLVSKIDPIVTAIFAHYPLPNITTFRLAACVACFTVSTGAVYAMRRYVDWNAVNAAIGAPGPPFAK
jgi:hypothetical protein